MEGESQPATVGAQKFMRQLRHRFQLPVHGAEERMTTMAAESLLRDQRSSGKRRRRGAGEVDDLAAQLILEDWMSSHPGVATT
jgi:putative Holliday junction resolvase